MEIKTVTVVGANGTMGTNVAAIFASFGNARVYLVSRSLEKSEKAAKSGCKSVRAEGIANNFIPVDYSSLEKCVSESDLVFESTAEKLELKLEITKKIAAAAGRNTIVGTGTSGLSVTTLAECFPEETRGNYFGIHMFNPPYSLTLCEVIPTKYTNRSLLEETKTYLSKTLRRTVVEVMDKPAFLGNRIGFQFMNAALQCAEKYKDRGGVDYIDAVFGPFSGRAMAPITTADFVGLDVHKAIVDNIYTNTSDWARETFVLPQYVEKLIKAGTLGRKTDGGLYKREMLADGGRRNLVYDIEGDCLRERVKYSFDFAKKMNAEIRVGNYSAAMKALVTDKSEEGRLCLDMLLKYILYSIGTANDVSDDISAADDAMATGFNWCPPLAVADALGSVCDLKALMRERLADESAKIGLEKLLSMLKPSKYDFRPYFRSAR